MDIFRAQWYKNTLSVDVNGTLHHGCKCGACVAKLNNLTVYINASYLSFVLSRAASSCPQAVREQYQ